MNRRAVIKFFHYVFFMSVVMPCVHAGVQICLCHMTPPNKLLDIEGATAVAARETVNVPRGDISSCQLAH